MEGDTTKEGGEGQNVYARLMVGKEQRVRGWQGIQRQTLSGGGSVESPLTVSPLHLIELVAVCGVVGPGDSLPWEKWMKPDSENV